jgi:stringent starvation protein B
MSEAATSTKPYMLRAMYEWCVDNGLTPHLVVAVDANTLVPRAYVKDGEIVLNINYSATKNLLIGNESITFSARFGGVANDIYVPVDAVRGIFARENGHGMFFEVETDSGQGDIDQQNVSNVDIDPELLPPSPSNKPALKLVK